MASEHGRICALAARCQRDLQEFAAAYPTLFPGNPFDATLFAAASMANAFGSPDSTADRLRIANRTTLWIFAVDWQIDYIADSREKIDTIVGQCLKVADGASPGSPLTQCLADVCEEVAASLAYPTLGHLWRDQLKRLLVASAREWDWKSARAIGAVAVLPTFDQYLGNADNIGSSLVNLGHWISVADPAALDRINELRIVSDEVQRILRLLNDLATYERDLTWGDLNVQMLGISREQVIERIDALIDNARKLLQPLQDRCPREAAYLERQIGYSVGFYGITDYWGVL
jgi:hypothetical protein